MRFLICAMDSPAYAYPAIGVARALQRRSHEVAFVTGPAVAGAVHEAGFERIPRGPTDGKSFQVDVCALPLEMVRQVKHIEFALRHFPADVLVGHQIALGPFLVAERQGLPLGNLGLSVYMFPTTDAPLEPSPLAAHAAELHDGLLRHYNAARDIFGLPTRATGYRDTPLCGDLHLLRSVPELEGDVDALPEQIHLVGACHWEPPEPEPDAELSRWLEETAALGLPLLYTGISFGDLGPALVEALRDRPVRVIGQSRGTGGAREALPPHFLVREQLPRSLVMPHVRAVVATGTTQAVVNALTHGLPSLLIAQGGEHFAVADRCRRAGVALCVTARVANELTPPVFRAAVDELLGEAELTRQARRLQQAFQHAGGPERVADLLERLGETRRPLLRSDALPPVRGHA